jgi:hypothetical protein
MRIGYWGAPERLWNAFHNCSAAPQYPTTINNYAGLLAAMDLGEDAIVARALSTIKGEPDEVS